MGGGLPFSEPGSLNGSPGFGGGVYRRFGVPMALHSDQGCNFESFVFAEMCRLMGIHQTRTTPLHPQSDGMVECFNRTLKSQLSKFVNEH